MVSMSDSISTANPIVLRRASAMPFHTRRRRRAAAGAAGAFALLLAWQPIAAQGAMGDCSQPFTSGDSPSVTDCLFILKVAVGSETCSPECICAPSGTLPTTATDALVCLRKAVGQPIALQCPCDGLPNGDDFNDDSRDPALWSSDYIEGNGMLSETGAVLRYTCSSGTANDQSLRDWLGSNFPYDADWEVQIDLSNSTAPDQNDQVNSFGISVVENEFLPNEIFAELYASHLGGPPVRKGFYGAMYANDAFIAEADTGAPGVTAGAVRIAFDAATKVLTLYYDLDPSDGYDWVQFASFGINGSGGADGSAQWGMTDADTFQAAIYGYSSEMVVGAGTMYGDNFRTMGGVPVP
jgi:hypothetical protein